MIYRVIHEPRFGAGSWRRAGGNNESWELIRREPGKEYRDSRRIW